jgi:hypothetical protein
MKGKTLPSSIVHKPDGSDCLNANLMDEWELLDDFERAEIILHIKRLVKNRTMKDTAEDRAKIYLLRTLILRNMSKITNPVNAEDIAELMSFSFPYPSSLEIKNEWELLRQFEYITSVKGFNGQYCVISQKGLMQVNPEFPHDPFIYGPNALK